MSEPLQINFSASQLLSFLPIGFSTGVMLKWFLYALFAFWAIYTLVAIYHWLRYSNTSWVAFPAIAVHIVISLALMQYILSGNAWILSGYLP